MYYLTFILEVTKNTVQDTNILMTSSMGAQTLKYFIMILLKGPDNLQISSNSLIHNNSNNMDATAHFEMGASTNVSNKVASTLKCGGESNL